jgi:hypothetical protein
VFCLLLFWCAGTEVSIEQAANGGNPDSGRRMLYCETR